MSSCWIAGVSQLDLNNEPYVNAWWDMALFRGEPDKNVIVLKFQPVNEILYIGGTEILRCFHSMNDVDSQFVWKALFVSPDTL